MLRKHFIPFFAFFVVSFSYLAIKPQPAKALGIGDVGQIITTLESASSVMKGIFDPYRDLKEFCGRRSGNQMNLETWYSGKCKSNGTLIQKGDSRIGEGTGFSDIVSLDFEEKIFGPKDPDKGSLEDIIRLFKSIVGITASNSNQETKLQAQREILDINSNNGIVGQMANITTITISKPPATTTDYLAHIQTNLKNKHIIPEVYAAGPGIGFTGFAPILPIWKAVRNIAYFLFAIMFVVYGIMIMLRVKIDPRTAITIELALPKIIVTLLLITFSYAIVGLLVDTMYVAFFLFYNLLIDNKIISGSGAGQWLANAASGQYGLLLSGLFNNIIASLVMPSAVISMIIGGPATLGTVINFALGFIGGWIINLIVALALIYVYAKTFWKLTVSYLSIILKLIFSPIILLGNLLPGSNTLSSWLMGMVADLSVFPVTMICFALSWVFMTQAFLEGALNTNFGGVFGLDSSGLNVTGYLNTPPIIGPLINVGFESGVVLAVMGFALLLMSSKYADMIKDALKVPPFKYGDSLGEALQWGYDTDISKRATAGLASKFGQKIGTRFPSMGNSMQRYADTRMGSKNPQTVDPMDPTFGPGKKILPDSPQATP